MVCIVVDVTELRLAEVAMTMCVKKVTVADARTSLDSNYFHVQYMIFSPVWIATWFFTSRRRHTRYWRDWSSDVCSSDLRELRVETAHRCVAVLEIAGHRALAAVEVESSNAVAGRGERDGRVHCSGRFSGPADRKSVG